MVKECGDRERDWWKEGRGREKANAGGMLLENRSQSARNKYVVLARAAKLRKPGGHGAPLRSPDTPVREELIRQCETYEG